MGSRGAAWRDIHTYIHTYIHECTQAEYIKPFGKAVMSGLEDLLGEKWDQVAQTAWRTLWQRVSTCVTRSLNVGTNLITVSLVNGDLDRLQDAITCAPRGERVSWVCRVEVYGSILSPIYWGKICVYWHIMYT